MPNTNNNKLGNVIIFFCNTNCLIKLYSWISDPKFLKYSILLHSVNILFFHCKIMPFWYYVLNNF